VNYCTQCGSKLDDNGESTQRNDGWERRFNLMVEEFSHMHVDNGKDDTCAYCGFDIRFDIRHELHRPQPPKEEV
jgi:hypothetical protein